MSVTRSEFFADANVNAALDRYADIVLDHVEARGPDSELPDPKACEVGGRCLATDFPLATKGLIRSAGWFPAEPRLKSRR